MHRLVLFLKLIRFPNLIMLALVQCIAAQYFDYQIASWYLFLIIFSTFCIAAAGYLFNNLSDLEIDLKNNKYSIMHFSILQNILPFLSKLSIIFSIVGLLIGFYLSAKSHFSLFFMYVLALFILWIYAKKWSKNKFIGNFFISFLIAESIWLIYFFDNAYIFSQTVFPSQSFILYSLLAFLLNYQREIVKDAEDIEGDKAFGRKSIPIVFGFANTKIYISLLVFISSLVMYLFFYSTNELFWELFLLLYSIFLYLLSKAKIAEDYKKCSAFLKLIMLFGLISPFLRDFY